MKTPNKKYIHKKTGNPYSLITDNFMFKDNGEWRRGLVLYKTEYDNPDGEYFARTREDFENNFEEEYDYVNTNKLPHLKSLKDQTPKLNTDWKDYELTEVEIKKHSWLKTLKRNLERTGDKIEINKDKTLLNVYNGLGDETLFDIKTGKIIDYSLGF